jgi:hypothetical protein
MIAITLRARPRQAFCHGQGVPMNLLRDCWQRYAWAHGLLLSAVFVSLAARADTPAQTCDRLANDSVALDSIDGAAALEACSAAAAAAPGDSKLQYDYGRALERSGKRDQAKQLYQWLAQDSFAPASAALQRMAGPLVGDAAQREEYAQGVEAVASLAERIAKSIPRDHEDPTAIISQTGNDPTKMLEWTKGNTRLLPYSGMLRGATGVLMDRAGNSLDRALFLADLLHRAGFNARIARASVSLLVAQSLTIRFAQSAPKYLAPAVPDKAQLLKLIGADPHIDAKMVEQAIDRTLANSQKGERETKQLYDAVMPAVMRAVGNDPTQNAHLAESAAASLREHFWVQRQNGALWEDLDPDADIVGKIAAVATFQPSEIPAELKHLVTLRLKIETLKDGKLAESTLLEKILTTAEIGTSPIVITHSLYPAVSADSALSQKDPSATFIQGLSEATVVSPALQVGAQLSRGQLYDFTGQSAAFSDSNLAAMGGTAIVSGTKIASGLASVFGDAPAATPAKGATSGIVTAEWLDIEVSSPGSLIEKHRRAVFDLLGAASRFGTASIASPVITQDVRRQRALQLTRTVDAYVFGATPSSDWIQRVMNDGTARMLRQVGAIARKAQSIADVPPPTANHLEPVLWAWGETRAASALINGSAPVAANIALLWQTAVLSKDAAARMQIAFDIVSNNVAKDTLFQSRVAQGVIDTIMEHAAINGLPTDPNTAVQYAADLVKGTQWTLIHRNDAALLASIPAEARVRMQAELDQGALVLAPLQRTGSPSFTWWRIDPQTGRTLGIGQTGMGDAIAEYAAVAFGLLNTACSSWALGLGIYSHVWVGAARIMACIANPVIGGAAIAAKATGGTVTGILQDMASSAVAGGKYVMFGS